MDVSPYRRLRRAQRASSPLQTGESDVRATLLEPLDDVGALAGLDHAEPPGLAFERSRRGQLLLAFSQAGILGAQLGDLGALATGLLIGGDPAEGGSDLEVEHERADAA